MPFWLTIALTVAKAWLSGLWAAFRARRQAKAEQRAEDTMKTISEVDKAHEAANKADGLGAQSARDELFKWSKPK